MLIPSRNPPTTRRLVAGLTALSVVAGTLAPPARAQDAISRFDYERCQAQDESAFRAAIEGITVRALQGSVAGIDFPALVGDEWRKLGMDEILDKRIDLAVAEVRSETSWGSLLQSLADTEQAQKLATAVAERVYRADTVKSGLEAVAVGVGNGIGRNLELATVDAAAPALMCLQAFLGSRYGATVSRAVAADAGREFGFDPAKAGTDVGSGSVLKHSGEGLTGAALLIVRRQLAGIAQRVGARVVGSVLSRLVSVVAGGVGLVLIAKDIWELRHGVMPIIAAEMKSPESKAKVQAELAATIADQIKEHVREIGQKSADRVVEIWQEFRRTNAKVLDLAERNAPFKGFVDGVRPDNLPRLTEMVGLLLPAEGEAGVLRRLGDGSLNEAVNLMPAPALTIARETRSVDAALKWSAVAGAGLDAVVEHEIYKRADPATMTGRALSRILSVGDRLAISRLAGLSAEARDALFVLEGKDLTTLAKSLSDVELGTLATYLKGLQQIPRERVLKAVAEAPGSMQVLASARVRDAIIESRDQAAAVDMMLRRPGFDPAAAWTDAVMAWEGRISPVLVVLRHPGAAMAAGIAGLFLLLLVLRLFRPRRSKSPPAAA